MYLGSNPTALQSQKQFAEALISLMQRNRYECLTIKEICAAANLTRTTFYSFFDSKEDVIRCLLRSSFSEDGDEIPPCTYEAITEALVRWFRSNEALILLLIEQDLSVLLEQELSERIDRYFKDIDLNCAEHVTRYAKAFIVGAFVNIIVCWFKDPERLPDEELSHLITEILHGNFFEMCMAVQQ